MSVSVFAAKEKTSATYAFDIKDEAGAAVPAGTLSLAQINHFDVETGQTINARTAQNCLNTNGVTIDAAGHVVWSVAKADRTIVNQRKGIERHRTEFYFEWSAGAKAAWHAVEWDVENAKAL